MTRLQNQKRRTGPVFAVGSAGQTPSQTIDETETLYLQTVTPTGPGAPGPASEPNIFWFVYPWWRLFCEVRPPQYDERTKTTVNALWTSPLRGHED